MKKLRIKQMGQIFKKIMEIMIFLSPYLCSICLIRSLNILRNLKIVENKKEEIMKIKERYYI